MLLNYFKLAIRLLLRNPFFTFINALGLSIGLAVFLVLWPHAQSELKTDQFHTDYENIARFSRTIQWSENGKHFTVDLPAHNCGIARQIANEYSEVHDLTRVIPQQFFDRSLQGFDRDLFISVNNKKDTKEFFRETGMVFTDSNFFRFFSFPFALGDPETALSKPYTVVLSEASAKKYFADTDPLSKVIYLNDSIPLLVTGVFKNLPRNTHFVFDMAVSTAGMKGVDLTAWGKNWWGYCYVKMNKGTNLTDFQNAINEHKEERYGLCTNCPEGSTTSLMAQSLSDVVFSDLRSNTLKSRSKYLLLMLSALSFIIPMLAWINYIGLSLSMLHKRLPEIGTRIVTGAGAADFIFQFLIEAAVINVFSFFLALTIVQLIKVPAEHLFHFYIADWNNLSTQEILTALMLLTTGILVTGLYPLLLTAGKRPAELLKKLRSYKTPVWIDGIITVQYSAAIALIIWISCVYFQIDLVLSRNLGIEKNGVIAVNCPADQKSNFQDKLSYFTEQSRRIEGIEGITISKSVLGDWSGYGIPLQRNKNDVEFGLDTNGGVDENFLSFYNIKLVAGRNFQADQPADRNAVIISEEAVMRLGFSTNEDALGTKVFLPWYHREAEIIGVYKDYTFRPFLVGHFEKGRGSFLSYKNYLVPEFQPSRISIRINSEKYHSAIDDLEKLYTSVFPQELFNWTFLDHNINQHYASEQTGRNQISLFTIIAIGIACLGLLGMISNKVVEKTKEIGIRKVLGARLDQIAQLLLKTTAKQIMIALMIGLPLSWFLTEKYLQKYSERIELQWWHYCVPIVILISIMAGTVATVVWKAARRNPVEALKYE